MSIKRPRPLSFQKWIEDEGADKVADLLGVHYATVSHWRRGHCFPKVEQMRTIKKLTKGRVGYDEIIDGVSIAREAHQ